MSAPQQLSSDFSIAQFAAQCGISDATVRRLAKKKKIPSYRVGNSVRIPAEAVEALRSGRADADEDAEIDEWVERMLATAPPLSEEQRTKLAELLAPVRRAR